MGQKIRIAVLCGTALALSTSVANAGDPCAGSEIDGKSGAATQRREQCAEQKAAKKAKTNDTVSAGVWGVVTGICATSCYRADWGDGGAFCKYSNWAGVAGDVLLSEDIAQSIAGSLPGIGVSVLMESEGKEATGKVAGHEVNKASCATAVLAAAKTYIKYSSAKRNGQLASDLGDEIQKLTNHNGTTVVAGGYNASAGTSATGGVNSPRGITGTPEKSGDSETNGACARAEGTSDVNAHTSCAIAGDSNLAPIQDPRFQKMFEESTGKKLGDFLASADKEGNPDSAMMGAMGNSLSGAQLNSFASAIKKIKDSVDRNNDTLIVAKGGRGGGGNKSGGDDMADIMNGIMSQLMPKDGKDEAPAGFTVMDFKSLTRSPSAVAEDRSINIFQRVSFRYHYVGKRILTRASP